MSGKEVIANDTRCRPRVTPRGCFGTQSGARHTSTPFHCSLRYGGQRNSRATCHIGEYGGEATARTSWPRAASHAAISPEYLPIPVGSGSKLGLQMRIFILLISVVQTPPSPAANFFPPSQQLHHSN